jgi:hypothetical protein
VKLVVMAVDSDRLRLDQLAFTLKGHGAVTLAAVEVIEVPDEDHAWDIVEAAERTVGALNEEIEKRRT